MYIAWGMYLRAFLLIINNDNTMRTVIALILMALVSCHPATRQEVEAAQASMHKVKVKNEVGQVSIRVLDTMFHKQDTLMGEGKGFVVIIQE
jgi:hypothetical protein